VTTVQQWPMYVLAPYFQNFNELDRTNDSLEVPESGCFVTSSFDVFTS